MTPRTRRLRAAIAVAAATALAGGAAATAGGAAGLTITDGPSGLTNDPTPAFTFDSASAPATCAVDGGPATACTSPHTTEHLADGAHVFTVAAGDVVEERGFVVDTKAPEVDVAGERIVADTRATITFTAEAGAETRCAVDTGAATACTSPYTTPDLANGTHAVHVVVTDAAGNETRGTRVIDFRAPAPDTTIASGPEGETADKTPTFAFTSSRPRSRFECRIDQGAFAPCEASHKLPAQADGAHSFAVRAVDAAGAADPTPAERSFSVRSCQTTAKVGVVEIVADCFRADGTKLVADGSVKLNGITLNPLGARQRVTVDAAKRTIAFGGIQLRMGPIVLYKGDLTFTVPEGNRITLARIDLETFSMVDGPANDSEAALDLQGDDAANVAGFDLKGEAVLDLTQGATELTATIELPKVFTDAEGNGLTGTVKVSADNQRGVRLDQARVTAPLAFAGGVELHDLFVSFAADRANAVEKTCNAETPGMRWEGGATALVLPTPNRLRLQDIGVGFADGALSYARAAWVPGQPGADLGGGLRVQRVAVSLCAGPPLRLEGRIGLTAMPDATGRPRLEIPNAGLIFTGGDPWTLRAEAPEATLTTDRPYTFRDLFVQYTSNGTIDFGGKLAFALGVKGGVPLGSLDAVVQIEASALGFIQGDRFNADLEARGCFAGTFAIGGAAPIGFDGICPAVQGVVSSTGAAVCGELVVGGKNLGRVGAGMKWGDPVEFMANACDVGKWRVAKAVAAAAGGERSVEVPAGQRGVLVALRGDGGPPRAELRGPGGTVVKTPETADGVVKTNDAFAFMNTASKTTYVALAAPRGGRWTVVPQGGSRVVGARAASMLPPAAVRARVTGKGRSRVLRYTVAGRAGQRVTFVERGRGVTRTLGTTTRGGRGTLRFRSADGPGGKRRIHAVVEQDGKPRRTLRVASYVAPKRTRPSKPATVTVARRGGSADVVWSGARRAKRYGVRVEVSDGRRLFFLRDRTQRTVRVPGVAGRRVDVRVVGLRSDNVTGPASVASLTRSRRTSR